MMRTFRLTTRLAMRRLWSRRGLMACFLVGLIAAVSVLSSVPMYSDAINKRLLNSELEGGTTLPPFAFVWRYVGAFNEDIDLDTWQPVDDYFVGDSAEIIGLPIETEVRHLRSPRLDLLPAPTEQTFSSNRPLLTTNVGVMTDLAAHIDMVDGAFPVASDGDSLPVIISFPLAEATGIQTGEQYVLQTAGQQKPITIAGIWRPLDTTNGYWFYQPEVFDEMLLTTESLFIEEIVPLLDRSLTQAVWYQVYDGSNFLPNDVPGLLNNVRRVESQSSGLLPGLTLDASPVDALETYGTQARVLTLLLTSFAIPIIGLVLYFVSMIAGMLVQRAQSEIAVIRSRGTQRRQIVLLYLIEGLIVGTVGLVGGLLLGRLLARLMTRTERFLVFRSAETASPALLSSTAVQYGLVAIALCLLALLVPAWNAAQYNIVSFRTSRSRQMQRTFVQRFYLDFLLLLLPLYGLYTLRNQGNIGTGTVFDNPLLFLVPALFCLAVSLLFIRFFPYTTALAAWFSERFKGVASLLTLRQVARATAQYTGPLLLLCFTLALATFTSSMAKTLDEHLTDRIYYANGSDLKLAELGEPIPVPDGVEPESLGFSFLPVEDHLAVNGVSNATRVGNYEATVAIGGQQIGGRLLGIDRVSMSDVSFFRSDFADESLVGVMNRLALRRSGLLVNRTFLQQRSLAVGDRLQLTVATGNKFVDIPFVISGTFDLFPTWYPDDGALFVAHLDYVHEGMDGAYPFDVWLQTESGTDSEQIVSDVRQRGFTVVTAQDARSEIIAQQTLPERQGLFGLLSVGFFASALLTVLGYMIYTVVGFQRRFVELGMLRAIRAVNPANDGASRRGTGVAVVDRHRNGHIDWPVGESSVYPLLSGRCRA